MKQKLRAYFVFIAALCCTANAQGQPPSSLLYVIHNCAEPALDTMDIYINGLLYDSNFLFRTALPINVSSDSAITFTLARKHSTDSAGINDSIKSFYFPSFATDSHYVLMISGVLDTDIFAPNPNGRSIALQMKQISLDSASYNPDIYPVDIKFYMGATDLPASAFRDRLTLNSIAPLLSYGDTSADEYLTATNFEFQLYNPDSVPNYGTYPINLTSFPGQAAFIFSSGFLNPAQNDSGPSLALLALINGSMYTLLPETAAFQLLHNCADPAADSVDVYINGQLEYPNFPFRNATPAITTFAYSAYQLGIAPKNSTSVSDTFWSDNFLLGPDTFYIATMSGLMTPSSFAPNPDGISTSFNVLLKEPAEYTASSQANFDFFFINGVTDAPPLSLTPQGAGINIISNINYDAQSNYITVPAQFYTLQLSDSLGNTLSDNFANFPAYAGQTAVLLTSGFLNSSANQNGPAMGVYMSPIEGGPFVPLFVTGLKSLNENSGFTVFPNPASDRLLIHLQTPVSENTNCSIFDIQGRTVKQQSLADLKDASNAIDVSNLSDGLYLLQIADGGNLSYSKFVIQRK